MGMDQAAVVVLHIGDGGAILFLPADGKQPVPEWHNVDSDHLGPGERPILDRESQVRR